MQKCKWKEHKCSVGVGLQGSIAQFAMVYPNCRCRWILPCAEAYTLNGFSKLVGKLGLAYVYHKLQMCRSYTIQEWQDDGTIPPFPVTQGKERIREPSSSRLRQHKKKLPSPSGECLRSQSRYYLVVKMASYWKESFYTNQPEDIPAKHCSHQEYI